MASLKDIATQTGYSIRTVSRVLRDAGYASADAREKIKAAAARLGYKPNLAARALRTNTSYEVVVVPSSLDELHMAKIAGIADVLTPKGYSIVMLRPDDYKSRDALIDAVVNKGPAGVIFASIRGECTKNSKILADSSIPSVFIDSEEDGINTVRIDRQCGVYQAIDYLHSKGKKKIAYIGPADETRLGGYRSAIHDNGLNEMVFETNSPEMSRPEPYHAAIEPVLDALLADMPDAVQCFSDMFAMALMALLHQRGVKIPQDIAVVGFDDRYFTPMAWPALTTVGQPSHELGRTAAEMLLEVISSDQDRESRVESLPTKLILRDSA